MRAITILSALAIAGSASAQDEERPTYQQMNEALRTGAASYELPQQIDQSTRLVDVDVEGLTMTYHYELNEHGTGVQMRRFFAANNLKQICGDEDVVYSFRQGVVFRHSYTILDEPEPVVTEVKDGDCG